MKKYKKLAVAILISVLIVIGIPLLIDWMIIGNSIPSHISNSDWVGFLGGYVGAIIGAIVSLIGIIITIRYTNEQNKMDRELQVRPYCSIRYIPEPKTLSTRKQLGCFFLGCEPQENHGPRYQGVVYIMNIGLGPAIEFSFEVEDFDDGRSHYPILMQRTDETRNNAVNLLRSGEEAILPINIFFNFDPISDDDFEMWEDGETKTRHLKHSVLTKYKNFDITITVKYKDMFQNQFSQMIKLSTNMHAVIKNDVAKHACDVYLVDVTPPIMKRKK